MSDKLQLLLKEIQTLENDVEIELKRLQKKVNFHVTHGKIHFTQDVLKFHRSLRKNILRYLVESNFLFILTAPVIYSLVFAAAVMDGFCWFYQSICFPVYRIEKVRRRDYIRLDRHKLAFLNSIEKFNCDYCSYVNGVLGFAREIASRTEQYWCPIRHAFPLKGTHSRYNRFIEYADADDYHARLNRLRKQLEAERK